jgi:hypothetical protein
VCVLGSYIKNSNKKSFLAADRTLPSPVNFIVRSGEHPMLDIGSIGSVHHTSGAKQYSMYVMLCETVNRQQNESFVK